MSACLVCMAACGGGRSGDAGARDDATSDAADTDAAICASDTQCDDGLFCNGGETCARDQPSSDAHGCLAAANPCLDGQTCNEDAPRCLTQCEVTGDADGDGHDSIDCGGDDCDDADPNRYPGNTEVCDTSKHDEDCDPSTFGERDLDSDGYPDARCCNVDSAGADVCGTDCQDAMPGVHPTETESCNGFDDNCDGMIDEGLDVSTYHPDCDADGFGATDGSTTMSCGLPLLPPSCGAPSPRASWARSESDCNDLNGSVHVGTSEDTCNAIDDNCDGVLSPVEDADRDGFAKLLCGGTDCDDSRATIYPGAPEPCNRVDDDCSLATDPGGTDVSEDADDDGHSAPSAVCSGGFPADDCDDERAEVFAGHADDCDGLDNDCDGTVDEDPDASGSCALDHTSSSVCIDGACAIDTCEASWGNCDASDSTGCEHDLRSDVRHCGACGASCLFACASESCDEAVEIAAGTTHVCARRATGRVMCWGNNLFGQLGDGTTTQRHVPTEIAGLITDASELSASTGGTCLRHSTGGVSCWGTNSYGQVGDGTTTQRHVPTPVVGLIDAVEISMGYAHVCGRQSTGQVLCWGNNLVGQLGDGTTTEWHSPHNVPSMTDAVELSTGSYHSCARRASGEVLCWGDNTYGRLGDGTTTQRRVPTLVVGLSDAVEIAAGAGYSCARRATGAVVCWGDNTDGQLGDGTTTERLVPTPVAGLTDAVEISSEYRHTCARRATGQVVCWGSNGLGQLGDGTTIDSNVPTAVVGLMDAVEIGAGGAFSCARRATGQLICWGANRDGELGDGTTTNSAVPVDVTPG